MNDNPGLFEALQPVVRVFRRLEIDFYIVGSVASSYHGASRSTMDVDLVADLKADAVDRFVEQLGDDYYASKPAIIDAISRKTCFNLIHLQTSFKVDVFVIRNRPFDLSSMRRAQPGKVDLKSDLEFPIASAEDTILSKLEWYRLGNEISERQWEDVVRVMKILGNRADLDYLKRNAADLKVSDLLQRLLDAAM